MFLSKIWFFLVAVLAVAALTIALVMPRPAQRATFKAEDVTVKRACGIASVLLQQNARQRIDLAANYAAGRDRLRLDSVLHNASKSDQINDLAHRTAKSVLTSLIDEAKKTGRPPDFIIAVDRHGRVLARVGIQDGEFGDSMAGYYLVDDALAGYMRDDVWYLNGTLYRVAAAPVVEQRELVYAGAVIVGHSFDKGLAEGVGGSAGAHVAFYAGGQAVTSSSDAAIHKDVVAQFEKLGVLQPGAPLGGEQKDCTAFEPFDVTAGDKTYRVAVARLPGEARERGAFYAVFREQQTGGGFMATLDEVKGSDVSFGSFPWIPVGGLFVLMVVAGLLLMRMEGDGPMKKLADDAVRLAKGEAPRLDEMRHKGKAGSIARSMNIALDKLEREAKSAKRDLDSLLGPAPAGAPTPMPQPPGGPSPQAFTPPPPSEFKFNDNRAGGKPAPPPKPGGPPPRPAPPPPIDLDLPPPPPAMAEATPKPKPGRIAAPLAPASPPSAPVDRVPPPPIDLPPQARPVAPAPPTPPPPITAGVGVIDEDILSGDDDSGPGPATADRPGSDFDAPTRVADPQPGLLQQSAGGDEVNGEFKKIFDEFKALKENCGESTDSLTYAKFADKLRKNRDSLIAKHGCKDVKFQVYIKDGKAALKATPVKS